MTTAFHKLRYTEGACLAYNDRHVKRWIILRTFPKCFFIVVSNYGFAFTNQFSRCSAINFRANWDIAATLVITSHHITSLHIKEDKKARKVSTITIDVVRHAICQVWGLIFSSKWRFLRKERTWWLINDVEHQKTILLESLTAGWLILKTVSKYQDMTFYSSQSLSKLSSICITLTQNKVCTHITCILTFWQP